MYDDYLGTFSSCGGRRRRRHLDPSREKEVRGRSREMTVSNYNMNDVSLRSNVTSSINFPLTPRLRYLTVDSIPIIS